MAKRTECTDLACRFVDCHSSTLVSEARRAGLQLLREVTGGIGATVIRARDKGADLWRVPGTVSADHRGAFGVMTKDRARRWRRRL
jgi:hypothetical protein